MNFEHERIRKIECKGDLLTFQFKGTAREANVLRRIFLTSIPVMAIDKVDFRINDSIISDESLRYRLYLVPIMIDADDYDDNETFSMRIEVNGESDSVVRTQDLVFYQNDDVKNPVALVRKTPTAMSDIVITKLKKNHQIELEAIVRKGIAKEHAKFCPVCVSVSIPVKPKKADKPVSKVNMKVQSIGVYTPEQLLLKAMKIYDEMQVKPDETK